VNDLPRYLIVGGEVFDIVAAGEAHQQASFLTIPREIRRNPRESEVVRSTERRGRVARTSTSPTITASSSPIGSLTTAKRICCSLRWCS